VDLVGVFVEHPLREVVAGLGSHAALTRELPFAAAKVQSRAGVVANALFYLKNWNSIHIIIQIVKT
jgi:hypothetical protein